MRSINRIYGWMLNGLGVLAGVLLGGWLGFWLGVAYVGTFMPFAELDGFIPPLLGAASGAIGGGSGWFVLRRSVTLTLNQRTIVGVVLLLVLLGLVLARAAASRLGW